MNGIFSVILKPIYGYILDKIGMSKYLLYFVVGMSALMAPFFIYIYQPLLLSQTLLGIIVGAIYLSFAWYAGVAACESYSDRYSRLNGMEFGQIRMWGHSVGRWHHRSRDCCLTFLRPITSSWAA